MGKKEKEQLGNDNDGPRNRRLHGPGVEIGREAGRAIIRDRLRGWVRKDALPGHRSSSARRCVGRRGLEALIGLARISVVRLGSVRQGIFAISAKFSVRPYPRRDNFGTSRFG